MAMRRCLRQSLTIRSLVRTRFGGPDLTSRWVDSLERAPMLARLLSSTSQSVPGWLEEYMGHLYERYKPPDKYMPLDGAPATAANVYARMLEVGSHKNKLNRKALHYLLRACNTPSDLETALAAFELYRKKSIEISEETALLFAKAAGRSGCPEVGLATLGNPALRVGLWSNAGAWNYLLARLERESSEAAAEDAATAADGAEDGARVEAADAAGEATGGDESVEGSAAEAASTLVGCSAVAAAAHEAMQAVGVVPDGQTYHLLVRAHLTEGDSDGAARVAAAADACGLLEPSTKAMLDASSPTELGTAAEAAAALASMNPEVFEDESGPKAMAARFAK